MFKWEEKKEDDFQKLEHMLCNAPTMSVSKSTDDLFIYSHRSQQGLWCVSMQRYKVISYSSRECKVHENNYTSHDLELAEVVFVLGIW